MQDNLKREIEISKKRFGYIYLKDLKAMNWDLMWL